MRQRLYLFLLVVPLLLLAAGCSTTKNLPAGEQLYIGIGKTKITSEDGSTSGQRALSAAENVLNVKPNNSFFGSARYRIPLPFGLWVYNRYVNDSTALGKRIYKMFASEPVLVGTVNPPLRSLIARNVLREHGYFNAAVTDSVATNRKDSLQARVFYTIDMGKPYRYDTIEFLPPITLVGGVQFDHSLFSKLEIGEQFNLSRLLEDRKRISTMLRNRGFYYYTPDAIYYEADTLQGDYGVHLRTRIKQGVSETAFTPWSIGDVVFTVNGFRADPMSDSVTYNDILIRYNGKRPAVRRGVIDRRLKLRPGSIYAESDETRTREALARLGVFAYTEFMFTPVDTLNHILNLYINSTMDRPWDAALETAFKVKSNNFLGPALTFSLARRNLLGGGESLSGTLHGSYEWQSGRNVVGRAALINSYELGVDLSLNAPAILLPGIKDNVLPFTTATDFTLSADMLNRAGYFRLLSLGTAVSYTFEVSKSHKHVVTPFRLQYNLLSHRSEAFNDIVRENPALGLSLRSQFIPAMGYVYTYNNVFEDRGSHTLWMEYSFTEAGNLLNAIYAAAGQTYNKTKKLFGVPFAQFVRLTADLRYTYALNRNHTIAARLATGVIYSFGNMTVAPYSEQFYVGGANSIRAYTVRSIGPGSYQPLQSRYAFIDQTGEFKLELNAEWRMRLVGDLHGALLVDAGNVWLIRPDSYRPNGSLSEVSGVGDFLRQIALGSGVGLRYDLGFFVIRFDAGVGLHLPYDTGRKGYYNIPKFTDALGLHLAIGYPF